MEDDPCKKEREEYYKWLDYFSHPRVDIPPSLKTVDQVNEVFPEIDEKMRTNKRPDAHEASEGFKKAVKELRDCEKKSE